MSALNVSFGARPAIVPKKPGDPVHEAIANFMTKRGGGVWYQVFKSASSPHSRNMANTVTAEDVKETDEFGLARKMSLNDLLAKYVRCLTKRPTKTDNETRFEFLKSIESTPNVRSVLDLMWVSILAKNYMDSYFDDRSNNAEASEVEINKDERIEMWDNRSGNINMLIEMYHDIEEDTEALLTSVTQEKAEKFAKDCEEAPWTDNFFEDE